MKYYKKMKKLALFLSLMVLITSMPIYAVAEGEIDDMPELNIQTTSEGIDNIYNKIHFYLGSEENSVIDDMAELTQATQDLHEAKVETTVSTNARGIATTTTEAEEINLTLQFSSNYFETAEYKAFSSERADLDSIEEVRDFRSRLNAFSKQYHSNLIAQNMSLLSDVEYNSVEVVGYSPYVIAHIDADKVDSELLLSCAESESVVSVCVAEEAVAEDDDDITSSSNSISWSLALSYLNAYNTVSNGTYTGDGIKIGIYESNGVCDTTDDFLAGIDITISSTYEQVTTHATNVTSVVAAIAPDAEYYASSENTESGISWFIEMGCDVVNCSFGYQSSAYRLDVDGMYDYQIAAHYVTFVKSAGNYSNHNSYNISSPGYAYNAITVGGVQRVYANSQYQLQYDSGACYISSNPTVKPNIAAFYSVSHPQLGVLTGTSYAAPQVTGCVALLMEHNVRYTMYPEEVISAISLTANQTYGFDSLHEIDNKVGAGVIDLQEALEDYTHRNWRNTQQTGSGTEIYSVDVNLSYNDNLSVALAWIISTENNGTSSNIDIEDVYVSDYDINVYKPDGTLADFSTNSDANVELVRFTAPQNGVYRISVTQWSTMEPSGSGNWISLTYKHD